MCPSCGARLRSKVAGAAPRAKAAAEASARAPEAERGRKPSAAAVLDENPNATLPPGTPLIPIPPPGATSLADLEPPPAPAPEPPVSPAPSVALDALMEEIRGIRRTQEEILALLRERPERGGGDGDTDDPFGGFGHETPVSVSAVAPVRTRKRKSVLLFDDDPATRQATVAALERAEVPVRAYGDGNAGVQALAEERADVLVIELAMGGAMGGKDVVNLVKATMEWVDIPIVLHTRLPVQGQKEARTIHGADELVPKAKGSEDTLVTRVIQVFRRP